jgi:hypothetical protein
MCWSLTFGVVTCVAHDLKQNDWVPRDKDLYVFSLQHCVDVQSVEQSIRKHLLQINYPMGYRSITSLAGSMLRGHSHSQDVRHDMHDANIGQLLRH